MLFKCAPEDPWTKWDKVWLDRARVILQGKRAAELARTINRRRDEATKAEKAASGN